ncbi:hypothetical protein CsSME_00052456 [Camellia sinensis var. sinensis]
MTLQQAAALSVLTLAALAVARTAALLVLTWLGLAAAGAAAAGNAALAAVAGFGLCFGHFRMLKHVMESRAMFKCCSRMRGGDAKTIDPRWRLLLA